MKSKPGLVAIPPEPQTFLEAMAQAPPARRLAEGLGVSIQSVYKWRRGAALPALDIVPELARVMGWPTPKLEALVVRALAARTKGRGVR